MENPKNLYAWLIKIMEQLRKYMRTELVCLDQCPYGETVKPTGVVATAPWMKTVRRFHASTHRARCLVGGPTLHAQGPQLGVELFAVLLACRGSQSHQRRRA